MFYLAGFVWRGDDHYHGLASQPCWMETLRELSISQQTLNMSYLLPTFEPVPIFPAVEHGFIQIDGVKIKAVGRSSTENTT